MSLLVRVIHLPVGTPKQMAQEIVMKKVATIS